MSSGVPAPKDWRLVDGDPPSEWLGPSPDRPGPFLARTALGSRAGPWGTRRWWPAALVCLTVLVLVGVLAITTTLTPVLGLGVMALAIGALACSAPILGHDSRDGRDW